MKHLAPQPGALLLAALLVTAGCRDAPPELPPEGCTAGQPGCTCYPNMTCDLGSACVAGMCQDETLMDNNANPNNGDPNNAGNNNASNNATTGNNNNNNNNNNNGGVLPMCDTSLDEVIGSPGCGCYPNGTCQGDLLCNADVCVVSNCDPADCEDDNPCTTAMCDGTDTCLNVPRDSGPCDDEDMCTAGDACEDGVCVGVAGCDDEDPCTEDTCDPDTGECANIVTEGADCDDGDLCTADDTCDAGGLCVGIAVRCADEVGCTADACDPMTGDCMFNPDDEMCVSEDACEVGTCDDVVGCVFTPAEDGDACTGDGCSGVCYGQPSTTTLGCGVNWIDNAGSAEICSRVKDDEAMCLTPTNFNDARSRCSNMGGRLCSLAEVIAGEAIIEDAHPLCASGCQSDCLRIWTSTACNDTGTSAFTISADVRFHNPNTPIPCTEKTNMTISVVCCADATETPAPALCADTAVGATPSICQ